MIPFIYNTIADRIRIILEDNNPDHVYEVLSKHFSKSIEELKSIYAIKLDVFRKRIFIEGDSKDIANLVYYSVQYNLTFESVTMNSLRIDLYEFFRRIY